MCCTSTGAQAFFRLGSQYGRVEIELVPARAALHRDQDGEIAREWRRLIGPCPRGFAQLLRTDYFRPATP